MSELMPIGPELAERNREVLAERLGWPDGAVEACREIEGAYPDFMVFYDTGGTAWHPAPSYRATLRDHRMGNDLSDPTAQGLMEKVAQMSRRLPRW